MFECASYYIRPDGLTVQAGDADDGRVLILTDYFTWNKRDHGYLLRCGEILFDRIDLVPSTLEPCVELSLFGGKGQITAPHKKGAGRKEQVCKLFDAKVVVLRNQSDYLMVTAWGVGTDGIGNHQHNDILSFELAMNGESFFVDPGCFNYTAYPELRNLFRSTSYHNTVRIDGKEINPFSNDILFRMNEKAKPKVITYEDSKELFVFEAEHYGYTRLPGRVVHKRRFFYDKATRELQIIDAIDGEGRHTLESYFHLDKEVVPIGEGKRVALQKNNKSICIEVQNSHAVFEIEKGWISHSYLQKEESQILKLKLSFEKNITLHYRICTLR
jgi:hypothetical protein